MRRAIATVGWATVTLAGGCEQPRTELVVRVESEVAWGPRRTVQSVTLTVRRSGPTGPLRSARTTALGVGAERRPLPLFVGVVAEGDDMDTPVWIEALGCADPNGCTVATAAVAQRAVVRFTRGLTQEVPLLLASACLGATCGSDERCATSGRCEPATRAQTTVGPFTGLLGIDAGGELADTGPVMDRLVAMDGAMGVDTGVDVPMSFDRIEPVDRGAPADVPTDAGLQDGAAEEVGSVDSGPVDAGPFDTGPRDIGVAETGSVDSGPAPMCPSGMRVIPAGRFLMGNTRSDNVDAQPVHGVQLTAFCMDETEVTVSAYRACVSDGTCPTPDTTTYCNWGVSGRDQHPINCVDWTASRAYCQWRGADLPTEAQWEYAARGTDGRLYPWGDGAPGLQLCWSRTPSPGSSCQVGAYPAGNSPFGLFDMAGNVREWTLDWYSTYSGDAGVFVLDPTGPDSGDERVFRGGSWGNYTVIWVRSSHREHAAPANPNHQIGFRCARGSM